jgi:cytochrome c oxidase cbb3-type subunit 4
MDINTLREVMTVLSFLAFGAIVVYAVSPHNRDRFDEAARVPLDEDRPFTHGEEGR